MSVSTFLDFLNSAPTAWHAVKSACEKLQIAGFQQLKESDDWSSLKAGGKYYSTRNGSSLAAFILPTEKTTKTVLLGSHTDSPALKLKPNPLFIKENYLLLALEVYGAPLLTSWFNRDLGIAGRIVVESKNGTPETRLVNCTNTPVLLAQLAIHLDREVNEKGFVVNKQDSLNAIVGLSDTLITLEKLLNVSEPILSHDLFLYPLEKSALIGKDLSLIAGYRIDNLASAYASLEALSKKAPTSHTLQMIALWDHEEIGSQSDFSAGGPFVKRILKRVVPDRESYYQMLTQSLCYSVDLAHATHPNFNDKHEPRHPIRLGGGVVIKHSAGFRYATDAEGAATLKLLAKKCGVETQSFVTHGNIPAGTTIGPIHSAAAGMHTVDLGIPQLSMHSSREMIAVSDYEALVKLLKEAL